MTELAEGTKSSQPDPNSQTSTQQRRIELDTSAHVLVLTLDVGWPVAGTGSISSGLAGNENSGRSAP